MKFFILALATVFVGRSKCSELVNGPERTYNAKEVLHEIFNIKDDDLNEKCDRVEEDEEARWNKIEQAISDLHDTVQAQLEEDPEKLENLTDADKYKAQINVIKTALPCANEDKVTQLLAFYKQLKEKPKIPKSSYSQEGMLEAYFNIKDDDLNEKCNKVDSDEQARWKKIEQAVSDFHDAVRAQRKEPSAKLEKLTDADKYKAQINVIKTALPCANKDKVNQFLAFYKQLKQEKQIPQSSMSRRILAELFNIKDEDLNKECDKVETDEEAKWYKIGQAVSDLHEADLAQPKEDQEKSENLTDADKYKAEINVIKTSLPCANEAKVTQLLAFYKQLKKQPKIRQGGYTPKGILEELFNIKDSDLNEKCDKVDTDEQVKWTRIGQAVSDFHDAVLDQLKEDPEKLEDLTDADKHKAQINVIKTALPCANETEVTQILEFYKQKRKQNASR